MLKMRGKTNTENETREESMLIKSAGLRGWELLLFLNLVAKKWTIGWENKFLEGEFYI